LKNPFAKVEKIPILHTDSIGSKQVLKNPFLKEKEDKEKEQTSVSPPRRPFENVKTTDSLRNANDEQDNLLKPKETLGKIEGTLVYIKV